MNLNSVILQSDRLTFSSVKLQDSQEIFIVSQDPLVAKYSLKFSSLSQTQEWIQENIQQMEEGDKIELVIRNKSFEMVGMIAVYNILANQPEFGLWIAPSFQRKGYASESINALLQFFKNKGYPCLLYRAEKSNKASQRLAISINAKFIKEVEVDGNVYLQYVIS